jgi:tRNA G18 (ribose-2'-O)-methylase SpoU
MKPRVIKVHSENNHFQHLDVLKRNRTKRQRYGEFLVEGVTPLNRAIEHGWEMQTLVYSTGGRLSKWAREVIESCPAPVHLELAPELMAKLSDKEDPSELLAVFKMAPDELSRIEVGDDLLVVVFDRPSNHGNLGTVIRSCEALGVDGLVMTGHGVDLYDTRTIRASVGTLFAVPAVRLPSHKELMPWLERLRGELGDLQVIGTSAKAGRDIVEADLSRPTMLVIGNETIGLSKNYRELCDEMFCIPMHGASTSLNVACAASVLLYEVDRQRRT